MARGDLILCQNPDDFWQDSERAEILRLFGVLDSLVSGMTAERFGLNPEVAAYCNAEELREAIDAWQALIAFELAQKSPQ